VKEGGAAASDEASTGTKTKTAAGLSLPFQEGDKKQLKSSADLEEMGTGTKRTAADGLFQGEDMHGWKFEMKCDPAAFAAVGASVGGEEDDASELMAKQLGAVELALDKGHTAAQFEAALKAVNDIGTVAAPLEAQLPSLQAITIDDRMRAILMSRKQHYTQRHL